MKLPLLVKVIIAIALGVLLGGFMPLWVVRFFNTINDIFSQLLKFLIPLIIAGLVAPAIFEVGTKAGKMLLYTVLIAYGGTCLVGFFSFGVSMSLFPTMLSNNAGILSASTESLAKPFFTITIPPLLDVMSALALAFMVGLALAAIEGAHTLRKGLIEFKQVISLTIEKVIIPLLPIYIFGLFLDMTFTGSVSVILKSALSVILVIFAMTLLVLIFYFIVAALIAKRNPLSLITKMLPAYFTALGTSSSAATIPVTLKQSIATGVRPEVAGFTVPLCATINMPGSALKVVACAVAIMCINGTPISVADFVQFIFMMGITMVAAPGVPGGAIMAALGILGSILGFTEEMCGLIITLYIAMDSFGTACNVTCDGAVANIINRISSNHTLEQSKS